MTRAKGGAVPTTNPGGHSADPSAALCPVPKNLPEYDKGLVEWVATLPCRICLKQGRETFGCDAAHAPRVRKHGDVNNVIPLCNRIGTPMHHTEIHACGIKTFAKRHGVDLKQDAKDYTDWYRACVELCF